MATTNYVSEANLKEFFNNIYAKITPTFEGNTITLSPNREYDCGETAITTLEIGFSPAAANYSSEYIISFTLGENANITFLQDIIWAGGIEPDFASLAGAICLLCFIPLGGYMLGTWIAVKEEAE